jgi:hypothetical protein
VAVKAPWLLKTLLMTNGLSADRFPPSFYFRSAVTRWVLAGGGGKSPSMTPKGKLIAIGGNEDKGKEPEAGHNTKVFTQSFIEESILKRVVDEIGGTSSRIAVITSASSIPVEVGARTTLKPSVRLGLKEVDVLDIRERGDVKPDMIKRLAKADGVMMSGAISSGSPPSSGVRPSYN